MPREHGSEHLGQHAGGQLALVRDRAVAAPERVRGLFIEMPVLEHGLAAAAATFVPLAVAIRVAQPAMRLLSAVTRKIPRTLHLVDLLLDFVRRDPGSSLAVLDGITFGRVAPPVKERLAIAHDALVVGHPSDPIHPFGDADVLARELPGARLLEARSIVEWRLAPSRLDAELCRFLDQVWARPGS